MKDTINEEDMLMDVTRTEIEKDLVATKKQNDILQEEVKDLHRQMTYISELTQQLQEQMMQEEIIVN